MDGFQKAMTYFKSLYAAPDKAEAHTISEPVKSWTEGTIEETDKADLWSESMKIQAKLSKQAGERERKFEPQTWDHGGESLFVYSVKKAEAASSMEEAMPAFLKGPMYLLAAWG